MASKNGLEALRLKAKYWQSRIRVSPRIVRVQKMKRKWASCSSAGTVTLAHDLARQKEGFQDYVIAHELLHLKVPNHSKLFKALMTAYVPKWRIFELKKPTTKPGINMIGSKESGYGD